MGPRPPLRGLKKEQYCATTDGNDRLRGTSEKRERGGKRPALKSFERSACRLVVIFQLVITVIGVYKKKINTNDVLRCVCAERRYARFEEVLPVYAAHAGRHDLHEGLRAAEVGISQKRLAVHRQNRQFVGRPRQR